MQWILQEFEDTRKLAEALDSLGLPYSWHKVIPFVGQLVPEPVVADPNSVVLFGSYSLWKHAHANRYWPGVFVLRPFIHEEAWHPYLLNGAGSLVLSLRDLPSRLVDDGRDWFIRPIDDSKEIAGTVMSETEIIGMAEAVLALPEEGIPSGSLRHDTVLMLSEPVRILREWRLWVVDGQIVTYSLYKQGARIVYRHEIDDDAFEFAQRLVIGNPRYALAYAMDVCRTDSGLKLLETNCLNAAGFYAADLLKLAAAIDDLAPNENPGDRSPGFRNISLTD